MFGKKFSGFLVYVLMLLVLSCTKDDSKTPVGGNDDPIPIVTQSIKFKRLLIEEELPSSVNVMFQATDPENNGVSTLSTQNFIIKEGDNTLYPTDASMYVLKRDAVPYSLNSLLMLDISAGADIEAIKNAAKEYINNLDLQEKVAIHTFSGTIKQIIDFTNNVGDLEAAINTLAQGSADTDLWGAVMAGIREINGSYSTSTVKQGPLVVISFNKDNKASTDLSLVAHNCKSQPVYMIGVGNNINRTNLEKMGSHGLALLDDTSTLTTTIADMHSKVVTWANSFYLLNYTTSIRGEGSHQFVVSVTGNMYQGDGSTLIGYFSSTEFSDVDRGLYVNWSNGNPSGIEVLNLTTGKSRQVKALSVGGTQAASYKWESSDPSIVSVTGSGNIATLESVGGVGEVTITVKDEANELESSFKAIVLDYQMGGILLEKWDNVSGTSVNDLTSNANYPDNPTSSQILESFEAPESVGDNYGQRARGHLHPTASGNYTFWITSDDASVLYLSTDDNPANIVDICRVSSWTNAKEWSKETGQKSAEIALEAGKVYYIEALHKEGGGGDNLVVGWSQTGSSPQVIPGENLSVYYGD